MSPLVECIPNFSGPYHAIVASVGAVCGACILDTTYDADHNRSVITLAGTPGAVLEAAVAAARRAAQVIDLRKHAGVHPRIGAIDVLPFVPLRGIAMDQCAALAVSAAERIWAETGIPSYLYGAAARRPECRNLADIRKRIAQLRPDIGGPEHHPTAGAVAAGARGFLIAFNVNLASADVSDARAIARTIRQSSGGLPELKALGLWLATRGMAQVSMSLTDFRVTGIEAAFAAVEGEAARRGVTVSESELIGLAPGAALSEEIAKSVRLRAWTPAMILENRLRDVLGTMETGVGEY